MHTADPIGAWPGWPGWALGGSAYCQQDILPPLRRQLTQHFMESTEQMHIVQRESKKGSIRVVSTCYGESVGASQFRTRVRIANHTLMERQWTHVHSLAECTCKMSGTNTCHTIVSKRRRSTPLEMARRRARARVAWSVQTVTPRTPPPRLTAKIKSYCCTHVPLG